MTAIRSTLYLIWFVAWTAVIWIGFSLPTLPATMTQLVRSPFARRPSSSLPPAG